MKGSLSRLSFLFAGDGRDRVSALGNFSTQHFKQVLHQGTIASPNFGELDANPAFEMGVADLTLKGQVVTGDTNREPHDGAGRKKRLALHQASTLAQIFQHGRDTICGHGSFLQLCQTIACEARTAAALLFNGSSYRRGSFGDGLKFLGDAAQLGIPDGFIGLNAFHADLAMLRRSGFADPYDPEQSFVLAALDVEHFADLPAAGEADQACSLCGDVIGAGLHHLRAEALVPAVNPQGQSDVHALLNGLQGGSQSASA